jgi:hypothetical protein
MPNRFLVHLVNPVSGWGVTVIHTIADDAESAVTAALKAFGLNGDEDLSQTLKAIPQDLGAVAGTVARDVETEAVSAVKEEPVPETVPAAADEAGDVAAKVLASLPADVVAAIRALSENGGAE